MQTFLPEVSYQASAAALDSRRLVKQLLECRQILNVLAGNSKGWANHPAVKMWRGYELSLYAYSNHIAEEMDKRGFKFQNNMEAIDEIMEQFVAPRRRTPYWRSNMDTYDRIMNTHRARLYVKDPVYYAKYAKSVDTYRNDVCCSRCNYYWPTHVLAAT